MSGELQYWDSGLFINLITGAHPGKVAAVREMWRDAQNGRAEIVLSNFILTEVRPKAGHEEGYKEVVEEMLEANWGFIHWRAVSRQIAVAARELAVKHPGLTPPDTIHLATALHAGAAVFLTFDGDHTDKKKLRRTRDLLYYDGLIGAPPLRIEPPRVGYGIPMLDPYRSPHALLAAGDDPGQAASA